MKTYVFDGNSNKVCYFDLFSEIWTPIFTECLDEVFVPKGEDEEENKDNKAEMKDKKKDKKKKDKGQ